MDVTCGGGGGGRNLLFSEDRKAVHLLFSELFSWYHRLSTERYLRKKIKKCSHLSIGPCSSEIT